MLGESGGAEVLRRGAIVMIENTATHLVVPDSVGVLPLPDSLTEALVDHTESFWDNILIRWTQEQDLIFEATLGELRGKAATVR